MYLGRAKPFTRRTACGVSLNKPVPKCSNMIKIQINKIDTNALLDSGCVTSVITEKLATYIQATIDYVDSENSETLISTNGSCSIVIEMLIIYTYFCSVFVSSNCFSFRRSGSGFRSFQFCDLFRSVPPCPCSTTRFLQHNTN